MDCFPKNKKEGHKGRDDLLYIDLHILKESKTRWIKVAMESVDNKKAYDMVLQRWINCLKMYKISESHKVHYESYKKIESRIDCREVYSREMRFHHYSL